MDKFDKSFEELLRERLENHEFEYDAGQWAKMQQKLQEHEESRWRLFWYWGKRISAALVAGALLVSSGWYLRDATLEQQHIADKNSSTSYSRALAQDNNISSGYDPAASGSAQLQADRQSAAASDASVYTKRTGSANSGHGAVEKRYQSGHSYGSQASFGMKRVRSSASQHTLHIPTPPDPELYASIDHEPVALINPAPILAFYTQEGTELRMLSLEAQKQDNSRPLEKEHHPMPLSFGVLAGVNMENAYMKPGAEFSPSLGLFSELQISPKFSIQTGLQLDMQGGKGMRYRSVNVQYGLDRDSSISRIKIDKIVYASLPLLVKYKLFNKLDVYGGLKVSSFVSSMASTQYAYYNGEVLDSYNVKMLQVGQLPGIRRYDVSLPLGIECNVTSHVGIAAGYQFGLRDITDNKSFGNIRRTTSGGRITLRYRI